MNYVSGLSYLCFQKAIMGYTTYLFDFDYTLAGITHGMTARKELAAYPHLKIINTLEKLPE